MPVLKAHLRTTPSHYASHSIFYRVQQRHYNHHHRHLVTTPTVYAAATDSTSLTKNKSTLSKKQGEPIANFNWERWTSHQSSSRYVRHMLAIFQSNIIRRLAHPLLSVAGVSTIICMYEDLLKDGAFPEGFPSFIMPTAPFDLTSFALALLLVFRTNSSYDRWLEVATVWSGLANRARDCMRQVISHLSDSSGAISPLAGAMCRWIVAYAHCLKAELVEHCDLEGELKRVLTQDELATLLTSHHRPSFALSILTELAAAAPLRESHRIRLDENLTYFEDAVGICERIFSTPIPLGWTRHTSRFMVIWLSALPLGLYSSCGWATIPLCLVVAFLLLSVDEIGVQLEFPFPFLPLTAYCDEIESDLFSMLREATTTKKTASAALAAAFGGDGGTTAFLMGTRSSSPSSASSSSSAGVFDTGSVSGVSVNPSSITSSTENGALVNEAPYSPYPSLVPRDAPRGAWASVWMVEEEMGGSGSEGGGGVAMPSSTSLKNTTTNEL